MKKYVLVLKLDNGQTYEDHWNESFPIGVFSSYEAALAVARTQGTIKLVLDRWFKNDSEGMELEQILENIQDGTPVYRYYDRVLNYFDSYHVTFSIKEFEEDKMEEVRE